MMRVILMQGVFMQVIIFRILKFIQLKNSIWNNRLIYKIIISNNMHRSCKIIIFKIIKVIIMLFNRKFSISPQLLSICFEKEKKKKK